MSIRAVEAVLHESSAQGTRRMVLVVIAECADADGRNAWPSVGTIAKRANVSTRAVQFALSWLVEAGELEIEKQAGGLPEMRADQRPNRYRVILPSLIDRVDGVKGASPGEADGVKHSAERGEAQRANGVKQASPKPSLEPPMNRARGTQIPEPFFVDDSMRSWVGRECPNIDWRLHTKRFVNWAKEGEKRKRDWVRTWKNWMLAEEARVPAWQRQRVAAR